MKLNRIITLCAMTAALALSVGDIFAQDNGGGQGNGGQGNGQRRNRQAGGQQGGGSGGGGNFDPAQMQQRIMDSVKEKLEFTNDTDWSAVQPMVQKVLDARRDVGVGGGMRALFGGGRNRGGDQGGQGGGSKCGLTSI